MNHARTLDPFGPLVYVRRPSELSREDFLQALIDLSEIGLIHMPAPPSFDAAIVQKRRPTS